MAKESKKTVVYSALEVANICGVVNQTVINWIKKNYLSAFLTPGNQYRVYQDDLIAFMKSRNMRIPAEIEAAMGGAVKSLNILVIEEQKGLNLVLAKNLEREFENHKIFSAFDTFEAGMILAENKMDVVLIDIDMNGIDVYGLCNKIMTSEAFGKPVIVVVTGKNDAENEKKLNEMGIENIFQKPVDLIELNSCFSKVL